MRTMTGKLVNHPGFYQNLGTKLSQAAEVAGTVSSVYSALKTAYPYVAGAIRLGSALI